MTTATTTTAATVADYSAAAHALANATAERTSLINRIAYWNAQYDLYTGPITADHLGASTSINRGVQADVAIAELRKYTRQLSAIHAQIAELTAAVEAEAAAAAEVVEPAAPTFQTIAELKASAMYRRWVELDTEIGAAITARDKAQSYSYVREDGTPVQSKAIARHQATIDRLLPEWAPLDEMILTISANLRRR
jgi:hypothetical protein